MAVAEIVVFSGGMSIGIALLAATLVLFVSALLS